MILARRARLGAVGLVMAAASCTDAVAPSGDEVLPFITVKHAWRPGERDSLIARIIATRALALPYVGDISDLAPAMFADLDSVVVVVPNPAYHASVSSPFGAGAPAPAPGFAPSGAPGALTMPPAFDSTWIIQVIDVRVIDTRAPADTVPDIVGVFWAKKGEETWHGFTLADRCRSIGGAGRNTCMNNRPATTKSGGYVNINTTQFDASGDTVGAGGGEDRQTTGEY